MSVRTTENNSEEYYERYNYDYREFLKFVTDGNRKECELYLSMFPKVIDSQNERGDTSLHLAVMNGNQNSIIPVLLKSKPNINSRNFWGQTPIHYAAEVKSIGILNLLLQHPGADVNVKDVNGYNALHTYLNSSVEYNDELITGFEALIAAHADINSQTISGKSILHISAHASFKCNFILLSYILQNCKGIKVNMKDFLNRSFLHACMSTLSSAKCLQILEITQQLNPEQFHKLLNMKDDFGFSPWMSFITLNAPSPMELKHSIELGGFIHTVDNLGNSAMHNSVEKGYIIDGLIRNGLSINVANMYGITAAASVWLMNSDIFDIIMQGKIDFDFTDRWGRTPLLSWISRKINPLVLDRMLKIPEVRVNCEDIYDSIPLHVAAYNGDELSLRLLLKNGSAIDPTDKEGDIPMETALRHGHFECAKILAKRMCDVKLEPIETYKAPPNISLALLSNNNYLLRNAILDFPRDIDLFFQRLLKRQHVSFEKNNEEENIIRSSIHNLIKHLCEHVGNYDNRFKISVYPTGSSAEGTKVGKPDEFDFVLCLETLEEMCDIQMQSFQDLNNLACLKFRSRPLPEEYVCFSDEDLFFIADPYLSLLFWYLKKALFQKDVWEKGNLGLNGGLVFLKEKPVINFHVFWIGSKYKYIDISIDLVPAVYKKGWWPSDDLLQTKRLANENVKNAGCFVLLQTKPRNFKMENIHLFDVISESPCRTLYSKNERRSYRISCAPAEIALMKSLPEIFRQAYALAKAVIANDVCPNVTLDILPKAYIKKTESHEIVTPSTEIKSYWIKNCVFYVAETMDNEELNISVLEITRLVYKKLLGFANECKLNPYLLCNTDVYEFEKDRNISINKLRMLLFKRKVCIDIVFAVLGLPVAGDNNEWLVLSEQCYLKQYPAEQEPSYPVPMVI